MTLEGEGAQPPPLDKVKLNRARQVDERTGSLFRAGFEYGQQTFSLSQAAQLTYLGMYVTRADLTYPVLVNTKGNEGQLSLDAPEDVATFYGAAFAAVAAMLNSGTALKQALNAAATHEDVDAITDDR